MGSNHFGKPKLGNNDESSSNRSGGGGGGGTSSSSLSSSRKNKKSNNNNNSVPKQPQRGLGVAQLEKIRLHGQIGNSSSSSSNHHLPPPFLNPYLPNNLSQEDRRIQTPYSSSSSPASSYSYPAVQSSSPYGFHGNPSIVMGMSDIERANIGYANSQLGHRRLSASNAIFDQRPDQSDMTRQFFKDSSRQRNKDEREEEEVDLELRLSFKSQ